MVLTGPNHRTSCVMKSLTLFFHRDLIAPVLALLFASGVCVALVAARILSSGNFAFGFLIWNLMFYALTQLPQNLQVSARNLSLPYGSSGIKPA